MNQIGHNTVAGGQLKSIIERVENLAEERGAITDQIKEVYAEAKANGYDAKTLRKIVALRRISAEERQEAEALMELYMHALGMAALED